MLENKGVKESLPATESWFSASRGPAHLAKMFGDQTKMLGPRLAATSPPRGHPRNSRLLRMAQGKAYGSRLAGRSRQSRSPREGVWPPLRRGKPAVRSSCGVERGVSYRWLGLSWIPPSSNLVILTRSPRAEGSRLCLPSQQPDRSAHPQVGIAAPRINLLD